MAGKSNNMGTQNTLCNSRQLSNLERQYVDWQLKPQRILFKWIVGGVGCFLIAFGVGFPVAMIFDRTFHDPEKIIGVLVGLLVSAFAFGFGVLFFKTALYRRFALDEKTSHITGILKRQTTRIVNPRTGGATTATRYMIGNFLVIFPMGCEPLLAPYENKSVELIAATFSVSNPMIVFGGKSFFDELPATALALRFYHIINIHQAIEKYGLGFLKAQFHLEITGPLVGGILLVPVFIYITENRPDIDFFWVPPSIMGLIALIFILIFLCEKIAVLLGYMNERTPYLDKLKG